MRVRAWLGWCACGWVWLGVAGCGGGGGGGGVGTGNTQRDVFVSGLRPLELMELAAGMKGLPRSPATSEHVLDLLKSVGLDRKIRVCCNDLSGGEKRKLSVALAFVGSPKVVYLDEVSVTARDCLIDGFID